MFAVGFGKLFGDIGSMAVVLDCTVVVDIADIADNGADNRVGIA